MRPFNHDLDRSNPNYGVYSQNQQIYEFQPTNSGYLRGDYGTLSNYGQHMYGAKGAKEAYINTNIKGGGLKYGRNPYDSPNAVKQESYHHRYGPRFSNDQDLDIFDYNHNHASPSLASSTTGTSSSALYKYYP